MTNGYFRLGTLRGIPIRLHWTALIVPFLMAGLRAGPWFLLAFVSVVLVHELGHAFVAWSRGLRVTAIAIHGLGGFCAHEAGTPLDAQSIAWGGVLAQAWLGLVLKAYLVAATQYGLPAGDDPFTFLTIGSIADWNMRLAAINLIPIRPLDGYDAWRLFGTLWRGEEVEPPGAPFEPSVPSGAKNPLAVELASSALDRARRDAREGA